LKTPKQGRGHLQDARPTRKKIDMASYFKPTERTQVTVLSSPVSVWRKWDENAKKYADSRFAVAGYKENKTFLLETPDGQVEWTIPIALVQEVEKNVPLTQGAVIFVKWDAAAKRWEVSGVQQTHDDLRAVNMARKDIADLVAWKAELLKTAKELQALAEYMKNLVEGAE